MQLKATEKKVQKKLVGTGGTLTSVISQMMHVLQMELINGMMSLQKDAGKKCRMNYKDIYLKNEISDVSTLKAFAIGMDNNSN